MFLNVLVHDDRRHSNRALRVFRACLDASDSGRALLVTGKCGTDKQVGHHYVPNPVRDFLVHDAERLNYPTNASGSWQRPMHLSSGTCPLSKSSRWAPMKRVWRSLKQTEGFNRLLLETDGYVVEARETPAGFEFEHPRCAPIPESNTLATDFQTSVPVLEANGLLTVHLQRKRDVISYDFVSEETNGESAHSGREILLNEESILSLLKYQERAIAHSAYLPLLPLSLVYDTITVPFAALGWGLSVTGNHIRWAGGERTEESCVPLLGGYNRMGTVPKYAIMLIPASPFLVAGWLLQLPQAPDGDFLGDPYKNPNRTASQKREDSRTGTLARARNVFSGPHIFGSLEFRLEEAVRHCILPDVDLYVRAGAHVNSKDGTGSTPLHYAGENDDCGFEAARRLIAARVNLNARDRLDDTALHRATSHSNIKVVKLLIDAGAHVNAEGSIGNTALMEAARIGNIEIAKLLIVAGADINAVNREGKTALMYATTKRAEELAKLLKAAGAN